MPSMARVNRLLALSTLAAMATAAISGAETVHLPAAQNAASAPAPTTSELVGQRLMVAMKGTQPTPALLGRIRRGEIGGVILFGFNIANPAQLRALTAELQNTARAAGRPPLLISTDQEGGRVRRLAWAGPTESATELGRSSAARIRSQGLIAGRSLRSAGVTVDLAPVADVPGAGSFMAADNRTFGVSGAVVARAAAVFARGLADARVAAAAKHFPGIGRATRNTDSSLVEIGASRSDLESDLAPFRAAIGAGVPIVMISNASYPELDSKPAPWSPRVQSLLRDELGFEGVTITDALDGVAATRRRSLQSVAVLSAQAGMDILLLTGSEASSAAAYERLLAAASEGRIPAAALRRSYDRILALKRAYG
jgi:beta-N-acetylhexosaminidase